MYERLAKDGFTRVLAVYAGNRDRVQNEIAANFDANLEKEQRKNDYDIIISTEVLAEGVNLHRAGLIVNYDTPWNSTRLMQRVGRINRIGTANKSISIFNFFPTAEVNDTIELEKKASLKLLAFHHALGSDSQIYSPDDEKPGSFGLFSANYTEERDERLTILLWLRQFRDEHPEQFKMITNLPLKIRTGRCENEVTHEMFPGTATVAYLKNTKRDLFFAVSNEGVPQDISFLDAVKLLQCKEDEPRQDIPSIHYKHVNDFLEGFEQRHQETAGKRHSVTNALSSKQKQALKYLTAIAATPLVNDDERRLLEKAKDAVSQQKYAKLHKEINDIAGNKLKPVENLQYLMRAISKYIDNDIDDDETENPDVNETGGRPAIIISETLVTRDQDA